MKEYLKSIAIGASIILVSLLGIGIAQAVNVTVPAAPGTGYILTSTSTGAWIPVQGNGTSGNCVEWGTNNSLLDFGSSCSSRGGGVGTSTNPFMATYYVATSTLIASQFPYASSTAITVSGTGFFGLGNFTQTSGTTTIASGQGFTIGGSQFVLQQGSGFAGIGTASPRTLLDLASTTEHGYPTLSITSGASSAWAAGDLHGSISFYTTDLSGIGTREMAAIKALDNGGNAAAPGSDLAFYTSKSNTAESEAMRLTGAGNVGIGTTTPTNLLTIGSTTPNSIQLNPYANGTSTFSGGLQMTDINETGSATSTFNNGINISSGCFSIAGTCVGSGVSSVTGTYPIQSTGGTTPAISLAFGTTTANSWSQLQMFNGGSTTTNETNSGSLWLTPLANPAGSFLAVDPNGKVISTSTPSGSNSPFSPAANYATVAGLPAYTYVAGVITEVSNGALSVDGANPSVGQRVLVKNESGACMSSSGACNNGLYDVTAAGSGIAAFVLTRDSAYNSSSNVIPGIQTYVISGQADPVGNLDSIWAMISASPITIGTTGLTYVEVSGGGAAVASVSNSDSTLTISPTSGNVVASLNLSHANTWAALQMFGNATSTQFTTTGTTWMTGLTSGTGNGALCLSSAGLVEYSSGANCVTTTATPAGSGTQIQYNNYGSLGATADFTYSTSTGALIIGGSALSGYVGSIKIANNNAPPIEYLTLKGVQDGGIGTATFPDNVGTVAELNLAQSFTGLQSFTNATSTLFTSTTAWINTLNLTNGLGIASGGTGLTAVGASSTVATTNGTSIAWQKLDLGAAVYGVLPIANGGTNASSFTQSGGILAYDGTRAVNFSGYTLTSSLLTAANASTTNFTAGTSPNFFSVFASGEATGYDLLTGVSGQVSPLNGPAFKIGTTTTWTATSSAISPVGDTAQIVMRYTGTLRTLACATGAGTLEIEASINSINDYYPASTTAGTYTFSTAFTKGQILTVVGGNPASSPTYATCTLGLTQTP